MHIRPGEFHVAEGRNAEAVPVRFLFGEIHQAVIVIGLGASGKEIAFEAVSYTHLMDKEKEKGETPFSVRFPRWGRSIPLAEKETGTPLFGDGQ